MNEMDVGSRKKFGLKDDADSSMIWSIEGFLDIAEEEHRQTCLVPQLPRKDTFEF